MAFLSRKRVRIMAELKRVDSLMVSRYPPSVAVDSEFDRLYEYRCRLRRGMYQVLARLSVRPGAVPPA